MPDFDNGITNSDSPVRVSQLERNLPQYINNPRLGIMRARVTATNDPWRIGRVRIRVPSLHGVDGMSKFIKDNECPWAMPCFAGGAFEDGGMFIVPIAGSWVWVFFENDDPNKPVYMGGIPSKGAQVSRLMGMELDSENAVIPWWTTGREEIPNDAFDEKETLVPERAVVYKSPKGHTILMDDSDGHEEFTLMDRTGMIISFQGTSKVKGHDGARKLHRVDKDSMIENYHVPDPYIHLQVGKTADNPVHDDIQMHQELFTLEVINTEDPENHYSTQNVSPDYIRFDSYHTHVHMEHDRILIDYKYDDPESKLTEAMQKAVDSAKASGKDTNGASGRKQKIEMNDHHYMLSSFDDAGDEFTKTRIRRHFKEGYMEMTEKTITIAFPKAKLSFDLEPGNCKIECENLNIEVRDSAKVNARNKMDFTSSEHMNFKCQGSSLTMTPEGVKIKGERIDLN